MQMWKICEGEEKSKMEEENESNNNNKPVNNFSDNDNKRIYDGKCKWTLMEILGGCWVGGFVEITTQTKKKQEEKENCDTNEK